MIPLGFFGALACLWHSCFLISVLSFCVLALLLCSTCGYLIFHYFFLSFLSVSLYFSVSFHLFWGVASSSDPSSLFGGRQTKTWITKRQQDQRHHHNNRTLVPKEQDEDTQKNRGQRTTQDNFLRHSTQQSNEGRRLGEVGPQGPTSPDPSLAFALAFWYYPCFLQCICFICSSLFITWTLYCYCLSGLLCVCLLFFLFAKRSCLWRFHVCCFLCTYPSLSNSSNLCWRYCSSFAWGGFRVERCKVVGSRDFWMIGDWDNSEKYLRFTSWFNWEPASVLSVLQPCARWNASSLDSERWSAASLDSEKPPNHPGITKWPESDGSLPESENTWAEHMPNATWGSEGFPNLGSSKACGSWIYT